MKKNICDTRKKLWDASIASHAAYINAETELFDSQYVENRVCPTCGSDNEKFLFYKAGGTYVKCNKCSMVYLNPVFKDESLVDYYKNNHDAQSEVVEQDSEFYISLYEKGLKSIDKANGGSGSILDIGCSSGTFLDVALRLGWKTSGIELNEKEFKYVSKKEHRVYNELLQQIEFDEKFSAVSMWDVFEHIKDGENMLLDLRKVLDDRGLIFMQIPTSDALAARVMQGECNMFDGLEHVNLYKADNIRQLAEKCGLKIISIESVIPEVRVLNSFLEYEDPYGGGLTDNEILAGILSSEAILNSLQGYKLQIVLGVAE